MFQELQQNKEKDTEEFLNLCFQQSVQDRMGSYLEGLKKKSKK